MSSPRFYSKNWILSRVPENRLTRRVIREYQERERERPFGTVYLVSKNIYFHFKRFRSFAKTKFIQPLGNGFFRTNEKCEHLREAEVAILGTSRRMTKYSFEMVRNYFGSLRRLVPLETKHHKVEMRSDCVSKITQNT